MSYQQLVDTNKKSFAVTGEVYDSKESYQTLTDLFTLSLLDFDVGAKRKLLEETEKAFTIDEVSKLRLQFPLPENLHRKLIHPDTSIIDFACGTGLVMEKLAPYISEGSFTGIDISETMLSKYDAKADKLKEQYPKLSIQSHCGDIMDPSFDSSFLEKSADVLICTLAFHHLHQYEKVAEKLKTFVKPGGWILIYDFYNEDNETPVPAELAAHGLSRHGLSLEEMSDCFKNGCSNVSSAREFKAKIWFAKEFIVSHCNQHINDNLDSYPKKGDLFCIDCSVVLGVAQVD